MSDFLIRNFAFLLLLLVAGCRQLPLPVQLPSPTHTSKPPTNEFAGLRDFGKITDHIWRGAEPTADGYRNLVQLGHVKSFLSLRRGENRDEVNLKLAKIGGAKCYQVSMKEWDPGQGSLRQLALALKTLKDLSDNPQTRPVYVHCKSGENRTGFVIATYRMVYQGWTPEEAVREMRVYGFYRIFARDEWFLKNLDLIRLRGIIKQLPKL
ncbi:MAG TPA: protein-tyrosine phosphatase family protein [Chthoniobacterales bacterium]|nr:protein-tyrosine phosphatase family protein [Chthoniobacterales bacterium]